VTGERYVVDPALARPELGHASERFVFVLAHSGAEVVLTVRPGIVSDEFVDLARRERRSPEEEERLTVLKREMAARITSLPPDEVYDVA
jgi:hypothetical protein